MIQNHNGLSKLITVIAGIISCGLLGTTNANTHIVIKSTIV